MIDPQNRVPLYPGRVTMTPVSGQTNTYDMERADQPTQEGTPLNRDTLRKLQADIRTYPIASGYTISAGNVVDVDESGEVRKSAEAQANTEIVFRNVSIQGAAVCDLGDNYFVVGSYYNNGGELVVGHINSDGTVNFTSPESFSLHNGQTFSLSKLKDIRFFLATNYDNVFVCGLFELNKESFSITKYDWIQNTTGSVTAITSVALSDNSVLLVYNRSGLKARIVTISGNSGSFGTEFPCDSISSTSGISATLLPDDASGNKRVCVCFSDANDSNKGKAAIATINSSNAVTWGEVVTFESESLNRQIACASDGNTVFVAYSSGIPGYLIKMNSENSSISVIGSRALLSSNNVYYPNIVITQFCATICFFGSNPSSGYAAVFDEDTLSVDGLFSFNNSGTNFLSATLVDNNRILLSYANIGNSSYGTTTILEVMGNQIAGSFANNSTQAIALQSGNAGESIEVIFSGTTVASFVEAGQEITSEGVYGFGAADGVLSVIPYWAGNTKIATGSYVGTGIYDSTTIELNVDFSPKAVLITSNSDGAFAVSSVESGLFFRVAGGTGEQQIFAFTFSFSGNSVSFTPRYDSQYGLVRLNKSGVTYGYSVFG